MRHITPRDNPCYAINLKRAANSIIKFYDKMLEGTDLSVNQFSLLNDIKLIEPCTKQELAIYAKLDPSTITRNLAVLKKSGYIQDTSLVDSRESQISLTDIGNEAISISMEYWKKAQRKIQDKFGCDALKQLKQVLDVIENIEM